MKTVRDLFYEFQQKLSDDESVVDGDFDSFVIGGWTSQVELLRWMGQVILSTRKAMMTPKMKSQILERVFLEKVDSVNLEIENHWKRVENLKNRKKDHYADVK